MNNHNVSTHLLQVIIDRKLNQLRNVTSEKRQGSLKSYKKDTEFNQEALISYLHL